MGGTGMRIYHTRPVSFNFLNGTRMGITPERLVAIPKHNPNSSLPFCNIYNSKYLILKQLLEKKKKKKKVNFNDIIYIYLQFPTTYTLPYKKQPG